MNKILLAILLVAALVAPPALTAELILVTDGKPNAVIVVAPEPPPPADPKAKPKPPEKSKWLRAAEALQTTLERMSGARLPIVEEVQPVEGEPAVIVLVGPTQGATDLGVNIPSGYNTAIRPEYGEEEGFVLKTIGNSLVVAGNNDGPYRGTIFAAYALLERLGCRWYFPGEWGEIVPEKTTIVVPALDVESRPDFPLRSFWLSGWVAVSAEERAMYDDWGHKIGFSGSGLYPGAVAGDGFLAFLVPPDEYFDEHPEWYAQGRDGVRRRGNSPYHTMLCLSNEEMFEEAVRNLQRFFDGERDRLIPYMTERGFGISPPDGMPYCYCDDCQSESLNLQYPRYGFINRPSNSEEYFNFASRLAREFPDKWVATMAYSLREFPPQGIADLPSNMMVTVAPITSDVLHPGDTKLWRRSQTMEIIRQYRELTPHVMIYDYNPGFLLGMFVPERDVANMAVNAPLYRDIGIKGVPAEGRKAFMQTWISYYVRAKLLWDADADVEAIKEDFYNTFFGPGAGPHVQAWWDACERVLGESTTQVHEVWLVSHLYNKEFTDGVHRHVRAALDADATPEQRVRVEAFALIAENLERFAEKHDAKRRLDYVAAGRAAARMAELKEELNQVYSMFISPATAGRGAMAEGRVELFAGLAGRRDGTAGELVADLPLEMRFQRDPFNEGILNRWYLPAHEDADWETRDTYYLLEQQEEPLNERGFHYDGYVWYRCSVDVPPAFKDRDIELYLGGLLNEGWIWVNGQFAGHREHKIWWHGPLDGSFSVGPLINAGAVNHIAVRVLNEPDEMGGLFRRGFLYAPKREAE